MLVENHPICEMLSCTLKLEILDHKYGLGYGNSIASMGLSASKLAGLWYTH